MRLLATVADAGEGLGGGALAGAVYEFSRHGDPFVAANAAKLLQQVGGGLAVGWARLLKGMEGCDAAGVRAGSA